MIKKTNSFFKLSLFLGLVLALSFYACQQEDQLTPNADKVEQGIFEKHNVDNSQLITAQDQGEGTYLVTGEQGTIISLNNSLVNKNGERVRGEIQIELVEIYSVADMILKRKQTVADYDGTKQILQSGGELFIKAYQNGEELSLDGRGETQVLLPTANTGGAKDNMELFYGEVQGEQIIWKPTGEKIEVINSIEREDAEYYMMLLESTLGWVNVDVIYGAGGDQVECIQVILECPDVCQPNTTVVAMHVNGVNTGVELVPVGGGVFEFCGIEGEGAVPLGGITVTFIIIIECPDGSLLVAFVTATINPGFHQEFVNCSEFQQMDQGQLEEMLQQLN